VIDRHWFRSFGELKSHVATCRRSHLSPDGGSVTRAACPPLGSGWLQIARSRQRAVATCRQTVEALLTPLSTAWQRMATTWQRMATGKEPKEKVLLLPPPLSHKPT
jgi:hypothetical protein